MAAQSVTLGGVEYPLPKFRIADIMKLTPGLKATLKGASTMQEMQMEADVVWYAIHQGGGYPGTFQEFMDMEGVSPGELGLARVLIGKAIKFYADPDEAPALGEAEGAQASP